MTAPIARLVALQDVTIHVETWGERPAAPTVVLAHGFGGSARNFRAQARMLCEQVRFVLYDARGHARSSAPRDPALYTAEQMLADLGGLMDALGIAHAVVGGLSMGAGIALRYALEHPDRVRGIVLAAFPPGANDPRGDAPGATQQGWAHAFADAIERQGFAAAGAEYAWGVRSGFDPATATLVRQGFLEHPPFAIAAILRGVLAQQPSAAQLVKPLRRVTTPTLVVVGADDGLSRAPSEMLARALPKARRVVVPGAGHVVNLAQPAAFNAALGAFLDGLREA